MPAKTIVILGGGAAGLSAALELSRSNSIRNRHRIVVVDRKPTSDFLPLLPDIIGARLRPESCQVPIQEFSTHYGFEFVRKEVCRIDLASQKIFFIGYDEMQYDFLLVAVGSETNFYDKQAWRKFVSIIDDVNNAVALAKKVRSLTTDQPLLIIGGGYTGIEIATNLARLYKKLNNTTPKISIVDIAPTVLSVLPFWMQTYAKKNLENLSIATFTGTSLTSCTEKAASLSNGAIFNDPLVIWAAGVRTPLFFDSLTIPLDKQKRIIVKQDLSFAHQAYAAGDCCAFIADGRPLRMAFQFAIAQGGHAARNISNAIQGRPNRNFYPNDLGYLIPMANKKACGIILGKKVSGFFPWLMHYAMCAYRSWSWKARFRILCDLLTI